MSRKAQQTSKIKRSVRQQQEETDTKLDRKEAKLSLKFKKKKEEAKSMTRNKQAHVIQSYMQRGPVTVQQLVEKTGFTLTRCQGHVDYEVSKGRATVDKRGRVVINEDNQPRYRNED